MREIATISPAQFVDRMLAANRRRGYWVYDRHTRSSRASDPIFAELGDWMLSSDSGFAGHEAVFGAIGSESRALMLAFVHDTRRGQAQGGLRRWTYPKLVDAVHDGLRLSHGMTRKNALAGLWWGGGKGIIAQADSDAKPDRRQRRRLYREYGAFVSSLRGCYVTAEDAGTLPDDIAQVFRSTRFVTCIPPELGGSGNPSAMTAAGVVTAMEAAVDFLGLGDLGGKRIALQGTGNVGAAMIPLLLERGVERIVAAEISGARRAALLDAFAGQPLDVRATSGCNLDIFAEPCDVLAPAALGGVLNPQTIPRVRARIVCGPANNPLLDDARDAAALERRGIHYVPDFVANRMGIVCCADEQYGSLNDDPAITRHLDRGWPGGIFATTWRVLEQARSSGSTAVAAAERIADHAAEQTHPLWGHRAAKIVGALVADHWECGRPR